MGYLRKEGEEEATGSVVRVELCRLFEEPAMTVTQSDDQGDIRRLGSVSSFLFFNSPVQVWKSGANPQGTESGRIRIHYRHILSLPIQQ